jgi:hypothetical protein
MGSEELRTILGLIDRRPPAYIYDDLE